MPNSKNFILIKLNSSNFCTLSYELFNPFNFIIDSLLNTYKTGFLNQMFMACLINDF